jgi:hypothetical protein
MRLFNLIVPNNQNKGYFAFNIHTYGFRWTELISLFHPPKKAIAFDISETYYTAASFPSGVDVE